MQKLKLSGTLLSLIFLSSCSVPSVEFEMCALTFDFNKGRCWDYQISKDHIGKISEDRPVPIEYMNNAICVPNEEPAKLIGWFHEIIEYSQDIVRGKYKSDARAYKRAFENR